MSQTLTRRARATWLFVSAACYAATLCGVDDRLPSAEASTASAAIATPFDGAMQTPVPLAIHRDPFSGGPRSQRERWSVESTVSTIDRRDDASTTVPDIADIYPGDTGTLGATRGQTLSVRATISGPYPVAYVAINGDFAIVRVGDTVGRRRIATIDLRGLGFADGTRLDLATSFVPTPSQRKAPRSRRDDRVRAELARRPILSRSSASAASPKSLVPYPATEAVTPAPLRTVDPNGFPVGVVPTPDSSSGTAYPIPYPYAARPQ